MVKHKTLKFRIIMNDISNKNYICIYIYIYIYIIGFGGLEVEWWPMVPKFAGSNPAEAVGFLRAKISSARLLSHVADLRHAKDL